ncbi:MAG: citrate lyase acyl carrier protein [Firmicutes bacterium]|jgi:citrate lyase subunit gamma (acyl carrier protein)|nr:citrate lyase acyl carrier protein [Bacillota bacterium]MBQ3660955.1 citrate lyase acyl carrier protein [Bacillota bacterium]MBQ4410031.1 citrate lyase acyl carrier protein [Bacillota bacterium]MBQ6295343.1 citrate lyase acyl carrier protein [Bacillota bacterium]MBR0052189.1 citrate lyase acyl carrier protein [Bacillota bacterium]
MSTLKKASCGTMESSDAYMELEPIAAGVQIDLQSVVEHQFGDSIRALAADMLQQEGIDNVSLRIVDRGALECTLRARLETLIARAREAGGANA